VKIDNCSGVAGTAKAGVKLSNGVNLNFNASASYNIVGAATYSDIGLLTGDQGGVAWSACSTGYAFGNFNGASIPPNTRVMPTSMVP
jgi:hypothetical protein